VVLENLIACLLYKVFVWSVQCVFCAQIMCVISVPVKVLTHIHSHVHFCSQECHCYGFWRLWKNWTLSVVLPLEYSRKDHQ
jgi:predicted membrane protein